MSDNVLHLPHNELRNLANEFVNLAEGAQDVAFCLTYPDGHIEYSWNDNVHDPALLLKAAIHMKDGVKEL